MEIKVDPNSKETQLVGILPEVLTKYYGLVCESHEVYMPPGVLKHLKKRRHWDDFIKYYNDIPDMISQPDYAGQNPKEPNTVELYKVLADRVLIAIKMNPANGLFLGSFYVLDNGEEKIKGRLRTKRIYPFSFFVKNFEV
jgi:hypothetical protein